MDISLSAIKQLTTSKFALCRWRYHRSSKCISSKSALFALLWVFVIYLIYTFSYQPVNYLSALVNSPIVTLVIIYVLNAAVLCLFPIAGFLADNTFGRYKTVIRSLYLLIVSLVIALVVLLPLPLLDHLSESLRKTIAIVIFSLASVPILLLTASFIGLVSNVIQFGMDQLHDSPMDHQSLFIYWFLWVYYLAILTNQTLWSSFDVLQLVLPKYTSLLIILLCIIVLSSLILGLSLRIASQHPQWFLIDSAKLNPYKLVYQVSRFAKFHKAPIQRSAFTFCEDEIPTGLDLGKRKYGGPFTTEEVEDVKVFYGILKVLFALTLTHFLNVAADPLLYFYAAHTSEYYNESSQSLHTNNNLAKKYLIQDGLLSSLIGVIGIPAYLWLVHPFILNCFPGMLKRIGLGITIRIVSLLVTIVMDTVSHLKGYTKTCMLGYPKNSTPQDISPVVVQRTLFAFSNTVIYTALNEFICSQSPHSMKGMLLGLSFAIRGVSELIAVTLIMPFSFIHSSMPSCGMYYYFTAVVVWLLSISMYSCVAKKYEYRKRDDYCNIYQYAEEYYSKPALR